MVHFTIVGAEISQVVVVDVFTKRKFHQKKKKSMSVWFRQSLIIIFYWIYHFIGVILYYSLFNLWHSAKMRNLFLTRYVGDMQLRKPKLHSFFSLSFLKKKKKKLSEGN